MNYRKKDEWNAEIDKITDDLYSEYGSGYGVLFGIPLELRSSVRAIVKIILERGKNAEQIITKDEKTLRAEVVGLNIFLPPKEKIFDITTLRCAVEFGFKGHENGCNLEKVLSDFDNVMKRTGVD